MLGTYLTIEFVPSEIVDDDKYTYGVTQGDSPPGGPNRYKLNITPLALEVSRIGDLAYQHAKESLPGHEISNRQFVAGMLRAMAKCIDPPYPPIKEYTPS